MAIPLVGDKMINSALSDLEGKQLQLADLNDKYIFLEFWSMTCMLCMKAAKELKVIHEKYSNKLNVVGINMDTEKSMWEQGSKRDGIVWFNMSGGKGIDDGIGSDYGTAGFPAYVLINTQGTIIDRWMGYKEGKIEAKVLEHLT